MSAPFKLADPSLIRKNGKVVKKMILLNQIAWFYGRLEKGKLKAIQIF